MAGPALIWFELASICLKKIKAHPSQKTLILEAFDLATRLNIEIIEVDHLAVIELSKDIGLTTYDACYIWLALELQGELITLDPFGGAKLHLLKRGKKAPLRVNPEQAQAFRPGSRRVDAKMHRAMKGN